MLHVKHLMHVSAGISHIYIYIKKIRFQSELKNFHLSSRLTDAVVVIYVVVSALLLSHIPEPAHAHIHTEANRGCHCATV